MDHEEWIDALNLAKKRITDQECSGYLLKFRNLAKKMSESIILKNHMHGFSKYRFCFHGDDATSWLCKALKCSSEHGVSIGNQLLDLGIIHHITDEQVFMKDKNWYQFSSVSPRMSFRMEPVSPHSSESKSSLPVAKKTVSFQNNHSDCEDNLDPLEIDCTMSDEIVESDSGADDYQSVEVNRRTSQSVYATRIGLSALQMKIESLDAASAMQKNIIHSLMASVTLLLLGGMVSELCHSFINVSDAFQLRRSCSIISVIAAAIVLFPHMVPGALAQQTAAAVAESSKRRESAETCMSIADDCEDSMDSPRNDTVPSGPFTEQETGMF